MANITIRDLPDRTREALRIQAAQAGISLEAHARHILQLASEVRQKKTRNILEIADRCFGSDHGINLVLPERSSNRQDINFVP